MMKIMNKGDIELIELNIKYAKQVWQFRREVFEHDSDDGNRFAGCMSIESASSAEEWIKMCQMRKNEATCKQTGVDVPSTTYFAVRKSDNRLVGVIDLRHHINHPILGTWGGHCGYTVRPSERGRGYAKEMLRLNLQNAKAHGIDKVLVSCYPSNKASEKVIRANGGVYEETVVVDGIRIQRFWIDIARKIKWIFFDIGSTLIDESDAYKNRIERTIADTEISYNDFYQRMVEIAKYDQNAYNRAVDTYGLKKAPWNSEDEFVYPEAENILQELSKRYKIGIIANQELGSEQRLEKLDLLKYIDLVIASAEEGVAKPDLRIFQIALERADCKPEEAVMVGDRLDNDIAPANKIGMKTVWIKQGLGGLSEPITEAEQPDYTVNSLNELLTLFINQAEKRIWSFKEIDRNDIPKC